MPANEAPLMVRGASDLMRLLLERRYFDAETRLTVAEPQPRLANEHPHFYEVGGFVEIDADRVRELTTNLLAGLHAARTPIRIWIRRTPDGKFKVWYGAERDAPHSGRLLRQLLEGNFLGMELRDVPASEVSRERASFGRGWETPAAGFIVGIPSERADTDVETRLDEAFEALSRHEFELVLHCDPLPAADLDVHIDRLGAVAELAHGQARRNLSESRGESYGKSVAESLGHAVNDGTTWTDGTTETENRHGGAGWGALIGGAVGFVACVMVPPIAPLAGLVASATSAMGAAIGSLASPATNSSHSRQDGGSYGTSDNWQKTTTEQWGTSLQRQVSYENISYSAEQLEEMARRHLARLRVGRSLGGWRVSIGLAAKSEEGLDIGAHALIGALRGDDSWLEPPRLVRVDPASVHNALSTIRAFGEVLLQTPPHPLIPGGEHPSTVLSSIELAHWLRPPARELPGIRMRHPVHFARALPPASQADDIVLGPLEYWGRVSEKGEDNEKVEVRLPRAGFCQHTMIAGTTGAGKTTTVRSILWQLATGTNPIPFLVLEPAKDEYLDLFESLKSAGYNPLRLNVGSTVDTEWERPLRFNPLAIPTGLIAGQHVEQIKILLRASFSMQESLPQILERVISETYAHFGLDSEGMGRQFHGDAGKGPNLQDLVFIGPAAGKRSRIERVVAGFGYEPRVQQNFVAALTVRLESFGIGLKHSVFMQGDLDFKEVLKRPTFINISGIPEPDVRRFLAAALFIRLYGERIAQPTHARAGARVALKHLLVLEEAHHFIRKAEGNGPSVELHRETNTLLANAFAELRSFGQGILVADQAPGDLDAAVLRNTNTKLCHGLFHEADCQAMADSMGLDAGQRTELRRLEVGQAVVFGPSHRQAVACRVEDKVPKMAKTETG